MQGSTIPPPGGRTFYVGLGGNDSYDDVHAQNPGTPWSTFNKALGMAYPGDTVAILPGIYTQSLQSVRDGTQTQPITIVAATVGTVTITPAAGSGVYIGHHHHVVEGLVVNGAGTALQLGPYKQTGGQVTGLVATYNQASGNGVGIKFTNVISGLAMHNVVFGNGRDGIAYTWANQSSCPAGSGATVFNNLIYGNGGNGSGEFGITIGCGDANHVANNTVAGNVNGGIRLGVAGAVPVSGTVVNNIVVGSPVGIKEPAGSNYTGRITLDFNDVYGNTQNYALGLLTVAGPGSLAVPPGFVDAASGDYRLGRVTTGQPVDSAVIDKGSDLAVALGLGGRTAFTDKYPDTGRVDLGYHGTLLYPSQATMIIRDAALTIGLAATTTATVSVTLQPGPGSDGLNPGRDYAEVVLGDLTVPLWTTGFRDSGGSWLFSGADGAVTATLVKQPDGSVSADVRAAGLTVTTLKFPTSLSVRIGDDYATGPILLQGNLRLQ